MHKTPFAALTLALITACVPEQDQVEDATTGHLADHSALSVAGDQVTIDVLTTFEPEGQTFDETELYPSIVYTLEIEDLGIASFDGTSRILWSRELSVEGEVLDETLTMPYDCHTTGDTPVTLTKSYVWMGPDEQDPDQPDVEWSDWQPLGEPATATLSCKLTKGDYLVFWDLELAVVQVDEDGNFSTLEVLDWISDVGVYPYTTSVITVDGQIFMTGQDDLDSSPMLLRTTDGLSFDNLAKDDAVDTWLAPAAYGDGALLAGGYETGFTWSEDTWTRWASAPMYTSYAMTFLDGRFFNVDGSWTEDLGQTWTSHPDPPETSNRGFTCITSGEGKVVIANPRGTGAVSEDSGETWTEGTLGDGVGWSLGYCNSATHGDDTFVLAMNDGDAPILFSDDGHHWEAAVTPAEVSSMTHVIHIPGKGFVAAGDTLLRSDDGRTWVAVEHDVPFAPTWIAPIGF